ncbi:hypothetical protein CYMTET_30661 [Cymbomonas tetramitiformis]|uniref:Uncharacterized protein n=1 Tax=Cymbomonas tetramitiformis TaxID=36881 RepID=A0AAE0FIG9_9CHLO|nr:hypothetical protein CYMTET_30661 [Cymbomonas tetramitiformis]
MMRSISLSALSSAVEEEPEYTIGIGGRPLVRQRRGESEETFSAAVAQYQAAAGGLADTEAPDCAGGSGHADSDCEDDCAISPACLSASSSRACASTARSQLPGATATYYTTANSRLRGLNMSTHRGAPWWSGALAGEPPADTDPAGRPTTCSPYTSADRARQGLCWLRAASYLDGAVCILHRYATGGSGC